MNISPASASLKFAEFQLQVQSLSMNPVFGRSTFDAKGNDSWLSIFSFLVSNGAQPGQLSSAPFSPLIQGSNISQSGSVKGIYAAGRNMALFNPESAYRMMTVINNREVSYKAQFSELSQMESYVFHMQEASRSLGDIALSTGNDSIKPLLQDFVAQYNNWIQRFDPDVQQGGLLADTQAAKASRFELEQNVNNRFFGIKDGLHGMGDIGITIDPHSKLASLDAARLDSVLAANKQGVVDTVQGFSANFTRSASLLNSGGNFILKQLDNLNRVIHYIADNKDSLQKEFGAGDEAKPTGQIAQALAAYNHARGFSITRNTAPPATATTSTPPCALA